MDEEQQKSSSRATWGEAARLMHLALPILTQNALFTVLSIITTSFIGHLNNPVILSGVILGTSFYNVTGFSICIGLTTALDTLAGQAYGAGSFRLLGVLLQRSMLVSCTSAIPIVVLWTQTHHLMTWLKQPPEAVHYASLYLYRIIPGMFVQIISACINRYFSAQQMTTPGAVATMCQLVATPVFYYLMIQRYQLGIEGAAYAYVLSSFVYGISLLVQLLMHHRRLRSDPDRQTWHGFSWDAWKGWGHYMKVAVPACAMICVEWWTFEVVIFMAGWLPNGEVATGVMGLCSQVVNVLWILPFSVGCAANTLVANELGAGSAAGARRVFLTCLNIALGMQTVLCSTAYFARDYVTTIFTTNPDVLAMTRHGITFALANSFCDGVAGALGGVLRGAGRQALGAFLGLFTFWIFGLPLAATLGFYPTIHLGISGFWLALACVMFVQTIVLLITLCATNWKTEVKRAQRLIQSQEANLETAGSEGSSLIEPLLSDYSVEGALEARSHSIGTPTRRSLNTPRATTPRSPLRPGTVPQPVFVAVDEGPEADAQGLLEPLLSESTAGDGQAGAAEQSMEDGYSGPMLADVLGTLAGSQGSQPQTLEGDLEAEGELQGVLVVADSGHSSAVAPGGVDIVTPAVGEFDSDTKAAGEQGAVRPAEDVTGSCAESLLPQGSTVLHTISIGVNDVPEVFPGSALLLPVVLAGSVQGQGHGTSEGDAAGAGSAHSVHTGSNQQQAFLGKGSDARSVESAQKVDELGLEGWREASAVTTNQLSVNHIVQESSGGEHVIDRVEKDEVDSAQKNKYDVVRRIEDDGVQKHEDDKVQKSEDDQAELHEGDGIQTTEDDQAELHEGDGIQTTEDDQADLREGDGIQTTEDGSCVQRDADGGDGEHENVRVEKCATDEAQSRARDEGCIKLGLGGEDVPIAGGQINSVQSVPISVTTSSSVESTVAPSPAEEDGTVVSSEHVAVDTEQQDTAATSGAAEDRMPEQSTVVRQQDTRMPAVAAEDSVLDTIQPQDVHTAAVAAIGSIPEQSEAAQQQRGRPPDLAHTDDSLVRSSDPGTFAESGNESGRNDDSDCNDVAAGSSNLATVIERENENGGNGDSGFTTEAQEAPGVSHQQRVDDVESKALHSVSHEASEAVHGASSSTHPAGLPPIEHRPGPDASAALWTGSRPSSPHTTMSVDSFPIQDSPNSMSTASSLSSPMQPDTDPGGPGSRGSPGPPCTDLTEVLREQDDGDDGTAGVTSTTVSHDVAGREGVSQVGAEAMSPPTTINVPVEVTASDTAIQPTAAVALGEAEPAVAVNAVTVSQADDREGVQASGTETAGSEETVLKVSARPGEPSQRTESGDSAENVENVNRTFSDRAVTGVTHHSSLADTAPVGTTAAAADTSHTQVQFDLPPPTYPPAHPTEHLEPSIAAADPASVASDGLGRDSTDGTVTDMTGLPCADMPQSDSSTAETTELSCSSLDSAAVVNPPARPAADAVRSVFADEATAPFQPIPLTQAAASFLEQNSAELRPPASLLIANPASMSPRGSASSSPPMTPPPPSVRTPASEIDPRYQAAADQAASLVIEQFLTAPSEGSTSYDPLSADSTPTPHASGGLKSSRSSVTIADGSDIHTPIPSTPPHDYLGGTPSSILSQQSPGVPHSPVLSSLQLHTLSIASGINTMEAAADRPLDSISVDAHAGTPAPVNNFPVGDALSPTSMASFASLDASITPPLTPPAIVSASHTPLTSSSQQQQSSSSPLSHSAADSQQPTLPVSVTLTPDLTTESSLARNPARLFLGEPVSQILFSPLKQDSSPPADAKVGELPSALHDSASINPIITAVDLPDGVHLNVLSSSVTLRDESAVAESASSGHVAPAEEVPMVDLRQSVDESSGSSSGGVLEGVLDAILASTVRRDGSRRGTSSGGNSTASVAGGISPREDPTSMPCLERISPSDAVDPAVEPQSPSVGGFSSPVRVGSPSLGVLSSLGVDSAPEGSSTSSGVPVTQSLGSKAGSGSSTPWSDDFEARGGESDPEMVREWVMVSESEEEREAKATHRTGVTELTPDHDALGNDVQKGEDFVQIQVAPGTAGITHTVMEAQIRPAVDSSCQDTAGLVVPNAAHSALSSATRGVDDMPTDISDADGAGTASSAVQAISSGGDSERGRGGAVQQLVSGSESSFHHEESITDGAAPAHASATTVPASPQHIDSSADCGTSGPQHGTAASSAENPLPSSSPDASAVPAACSQASEPLRLQAAGNVGESRMHDQVAASPHLQAGMEGVQHDSTTTDTDTSKVSWDSEPRPLTPGARPRFRRKSIGRVHKRMNVDAAQAATDSALPQLEAHLDRAAYAASTIADWLKWSAATRASDTSPLHTRQRQYYKAQLQQACDHLQSLVTQCSRIMELQARKGVSEDTQESLSQLRERMSEVAGIMEKAVEMAQGGLSTVPGVNMPYAEEATSGSAPASRYVSSPSERHVEKVLFASDAGLFLSSPDPPVHGIGTAQNSANALQTSAANVNNDKTQAQNSQLTVSSDTNQRTEMGSGDECIVVHSDSLATEEGLVDTATHAEDAEDSAGAHDGATAVDQSAASKAGIDNDSNFDRASPSADLQSTVSAMVPTDGDASTVPELSKDADGGTFRIDSGGMKGSADADAGFVVTPLPARSFKAVMENLTTLEDVATFAPPDVQLELEGLQVMSVMMAELVDNLDEGVTSCGSSGDLVGLEEASGSRSDSACTPRSRPHRPSSLSACVVGSFEMHHLPPDQPRTPPRTQPLTDTASTTSKAAPSLSEAAAAASTDTDTCVSADTGSCACIDTGADASVDTDEGADSAGTADQDVVSKADTSNEQVWARAKSPLKVSQFKKVKLSELKSSEAGVERVSSGVGLDALTAQSAE